MNINQWNILSNLIHSFDESGGYSFTENFIRTQNILPVKQRFKYSAVKDFFTSLKLKIVLVLKKNRDFHSLSLNDQQNLFRISIEYTTTIGQMFTLRQHKLFNDPSFYYSTEIIFQPNSTAFTQHIINQLDSDDTLIKLILVTFFFSTTNYTVYTTSNLTYLTDINAILSIQNLYIEIAWRYLLYRYGYYQTVMRFSNLIRCLLLVIHAIVDAHESQQYLEIMNNVIQQTEDRFNVYSNCL